MPVRLPLSRKDMLWLSAAVILGVALIVGLLSQHATTTGRAQNDDWQTMFEGLVERNATVTIGFAAPLTPNNETSRTVDAASLQVGDDFICFLEAWNQGFRKTCTPFTNIASLTFIE